MKKKRPPHGFNAISHVCKSFSTESAKFTSTREPKKEMNDSFTRKYPCTYQNLHREWSFWFHLHRNRLTESKQKNRISRTNPLSLNYDITDISQFIKFYFNKWNTRDNLLHECSLGFNFQMLGIMYKNLLTNEKEENVINCHLEWKTLMWPLTNFRYKTLFSSFSHLWGRKTRFCPFNFYCLCIKI